MSENARIALDDSEFDRDIRLRSEQQFGFPEMQRFL